MSLKQYQIPPQLFVFASAVFGMQIVFGLLIQDLPSWFSRGLIASGFLVFGSVGPWSCADLYVSWRFPNILPCRDFLLWQHRLERLFVFLAVLALVFFVSLLLALWVGLWGALVAYLSLAGWCSGILFFGIPLVLEMSDKSCSSMLSPICRKPGTLCTSSISLNQVPAPPAF